MQYRRLSLLLVLPFLLSVGSSLVHAEDEGTVHVLVDPSRVPPDQLPKSKELKVKVGTLPAKKKSEIPDREVREKVFASVPKLENHLEGFDELSRDLLYVKAKNKTVAALSKEFPNIPSDTLKKLKAAVMKEEARSE